MTKPPLGPIPWLPPRGWCGCPARGHPAAERCPTPIPLSDPTGHIFLAPDAPLQAVHDFHRRLNP